MAEGRFVSKSIAHDWDLNSVSFEADYLFGRCIPHLDREGRINGHPGELKGVAVPLRKEMTPEVIDRCLGELAAKDLVLWYSVDNCPVLWFKGFEKHQKGLRKERESPSKLPAPQDPRTQRISSLLRSNDGELWSSRDKVEVEVKGEVKGKVPESDRLEFASKLEGAGTPERPGQSVGDFEDPVDAFATSHPAGFQVLLTRTHRGGLEATIATIRMRILYRDGTGNPDPTVKGVPWPERARILEAALLEYADKGNAEWDTRAVLGFWGRLKRSRGEQERELSEKAEKRWDGRRIIDRDGKDVTDLVKRGRPPPEPEGDPNSQILDLIERMARSKAMPDAKP